MTAFSSNPAIDLRGAILPDISVRAAAGSSDAAAVTRELRLVQRAQAGDTGAFRLLVESHQAMIHRLCLQWLGCEDDAGEACQDTFLKAWQALPAWQPRGRLGTWLYQIALNQCRDRARSRAARQKRATIPLDGLGTAPACPKASPDLAASRQGDMEKLQRGLLVLPESARAVLILCGVESMSYQEAAEVLKCSVRALEGRLYRARQQLLEWWERHP